MSKICSNKFFVEQALLWNNHVWYTTRFLVAAVNSLGETAVDTSELLANQSDIGSNFGVYFGTTKGGQLTVLLKEHILIAADIVAAVLAGDMQKTEELLVKWAANGKDVAKFYYKALDGTKLSDLETMWQAHLDSTAEELMTLVSKNYEANAVALDVVLEHMTMWSQYLSERMCKTTRDDKHCGHCKKKCDNGCKHSHHH